jgi:hypothetical protein
MKGNSAKRSNRHKRKGKTKLSFMAKRLAEILAWDMLPNRPVDKAEERFKLALAKSDPAI